MKVTALSAPPVAVAAAALWFFNLSLRYPVVEISFANM